MQSRLLACALASAALLLSACAAAPYQPLQAQLRKSIDDTEVALGIAQREINAQINASNISAATGGGLLVALIDSAVNNSRVKDAEQEVTPLRDRLLAYDFDGRMKAHVDTALRQLTWLNPQPARILKDASDSGYATYLRQSRSPAVALISVAYSVTADFSALTIDMKAWLMPVRAPLQSEKPIVRSNGTVDFSAAVYRNTFLFTATLPAPTDVLASNRDRWVASDGALLRRTIEAGMTQLTEALAYDIDADASSPAGSEQAFTLPSGVTASRLSSGAIRLSGTTDALPQPSASAALPTTAPDPRPSSPMPAKQAVASPPITAAPVTATPDVAPSMEPPVAVPRTSAQAPVAAAPTPRPGPQVPVRLPANAAPTERAAAAPVVAPSAPEPSSAPLTAPVGPATPPAPVTQPSGETRTYTAVALRNQPALDSPTNRILPPGTPVQIRGSVRNGDGQWIYVQAVGTSGWLLPTEVSGAMP